jgi:hypothetical protein
MSKWIKEHQMFANSILVIFLGAFCYCAANGWLYYFFDVIAKLSPAVAGFAAYYIWSKNRDRELKEMDYKNDYYKKIIDKRIQTYEILEKLDAMIQVTRSHNNKKYAIIFKDKKTMQEVHKEMLDASEYAMWMSLEAYTWLKTLVDMIVEVRKNHFVDDNAVIEFGITYQEEMVKLHNRIRKIIVCDMIDLYDVTSFLSNRAEFLSKKES